MRELPSRSLSEAPENSLRQKNKQGLFAQRQQKKVAGGKHKKNNCCWKKTGVTGEAPQNGGARIAKEVTVLEAPNDVYLCAGRPVA